MTIFALQELGNKAFLNKNFDEAIEMFTKAIEEDPEDPVFYTNSKDTQFVQRLE